MEIKIACETKERMKISEMIEFQNGLKLRNDIDYAKIRKSIEKYGFSFPFFVWKNEDKNYILDGHGRFETLCRMQKDGYLIPDLPVVEVQAKDKKEAKQKLLRLNSQYGKMSRESVLEFADDLDLNFDEIALPDSIIDFTDGEVIKEKIEKKTVDISIDNLALDERMQNAKYVFYSFSGGKDSTLALMSTYKIFTEQGKDVEVLYVDNGAEFPDLIMHIKRVCNILNARLTVLSTGKNLITEYIDKGVFPDPVFMDCVETLINKPLDDYMKAKTNGEDYILVRGGKKSQKTSRSKTDRIQTVASKPNMIIYNPCYDYDEKQLNAEIPEWAGYSKGFLRTACWCCPFQKEQQWEALKNNYPLLYDELKIIFETTKYKVIKGDGHPKYVKEYWEKKCGIKCLFTDVF